MQTTKLDWRRIRTALWQEARKTQNPEKIPWIVERLESLIAASPNSDWSHVMLIRVGKIFLNQERPTIIAPCCPDYSHERERYTFYGLGNGVSLLAERHIAFLQKIQVVVPETEILFLMADHEADDSVLCQAVKKTPEEFLTLVHGSIAATKKRIEPLGWKVMAMTEAIPDLVAQEIEIVEWLKSNDKFRDRLKLESASRQSMYQKISLAARQKIDSEEGVIRTIKTAAQYVVMGRFVAEKHHLVANHTTTNLGWYRETGAAVIHNPVVIC